MGDDRPSWTATWLSRRALFAHFALIMWFPGCLVAGWWQATVALAGNGLSYLYAVEWPVFAIFGVVLWWNVVHDRPGTYGAKRLKELREEKEAEMTRPQREHASFRTGHEDPALRDYNDYLEELAKQGSTKTWKIH